MPKFDDLVTPAYKALLRERYTRPGWGASGHHHAEDVATFAFEIGAESILDYGCGRGTLKKRFTDTVTPIARFDVREYDPGIIGKDARPEPADLVVSTDVLEHIEPDRLYPTLHFIKRFSLKGTFLIVALSPAKEILADGRNAHLIVEPAKWWLEMLRGAGFDVVRHEVRKGLRAWCWA